MTHELEIDISYQQMVSIARVAKRYRESGHYFGARTPDAEKLKAILQLFAASDEWLHGFCLASLDFYAITVAVSFSCEADTVIIADSSAFYSFQHLGDKKVLFADKVLKFTSSGKMKRRILLMTDFAIYIVDPDIDALKRRISLAAVEKLCLSELSDNFLAIIIPTEYDLLMASTRKTEIVTVLVDATKSQSDYELEVLLSNRFEYNATSELVKEIDFEETEGGVRTRIVRK
uniref:Myosin IB heavy chain-like n=1 Tax=Nicotiana sylvestris TaxID=4096 RepID=A0A1U7W9G2_NICSY|nr:PREDICTED: myosin IB heavy chain-like [Nicotiana sylvestris]